MQERQHKCQSTKYIRKYFYKDMCIYWYFFKENLQVSLETEFQKDQEPLDLLS